MLYRQYHFEAFAGIDNVDSREKIFHKAALTYLSSAVNVDITNSGAVCSRKRTSVFHPTGCSRIVSFLDYLAVFSHPFLYLINVYGDTIQIASLTRQSIDMCSLGDMLFFTGDRWMSRYSLDSGVIEPEDKVFVTFDRTFSELEGKEFVLTGKEDVQFHEKFGLKTGDFCSIYRGRLFSAKDDTLLFSSALDYLYMSSFNYMILPSRITSLTGTESFLFIGTLNGPLALFAENDDFSLVPIGGVEEPVLLRSSVSVNSDFFGFRQSGGSVVIFSIPSGIYATDGKSCFPLNDKYRIGNVDSVGAFLLQRKVFDGSDVVQYFLVTK